MAAEALSPQETENRLAALHGWTLDGDHLARGYKLGSHFAATAMVVHISQVQEELNHHSELTLGYNTVTLAVHTHSAGGAVTDLDFELARRVEELAAAHGAH